MILKMSKRFKIYLFLKINTFKKLIILNNWNIINNLIFIHLNYLIYFLIYNYNIQVKHFYIIFLKLLH